VAGALLKLLLLLLLAMCGVKRGVDAWGDVWGIRLHQVNHALGWYYSSPDICRTTHRRREH
jgi:hypothetical protein